MTRDHQGAQAFYSSVFGYTDEAVGGGFTYSTIKRGSDGEAVAGIGELDDGVPAEVPASWNTYFMVADCDATTAKAADLGATVVSQPQDTPFGRMSSLIGAQGETFSLIQPPPLDGSARAGSQA